MADAATAVPSGPPPLTGLLGQIANSGVPTTTDFGNSINFNKLGLDDVLKLVQSGDYDKLGALDAHQLRQRWQDLQSEQMQGKLPAASSPITMPVPKEFADLASRQGQLDALKGREVDHVNGAPYGVGIHMSGQNDPEKKLDVLRGYAPDAQPFGDDNFIYTDPKTGRLTLADPGLLRDPAKYLATSIPTMAELPGAAGGSIIGAGAGTAAAGPGVGTVAGAGVGAGFGAAWARMAAQRAIQGIFGDAPSVSGKDVADFGKTAALNMGGEAFGRAVLNPAMRTIFGGMLGVPSSAAGDVADRAAAAQRSGVTSLPQGRVIGSRFLTGTENTLGPAGLTGDLVGKDISKSIGEGATEADRIAGQLSTDSTNPAVIPGDKETAVGSVAGALKSHTDWFDTQREALDNAIGNEIGRGQRMPLFQTAKNLANNIMAYTRAKGSNEVLLPAIQHAAKALGDLKGSNVPDAVLNLAKGTPDPDAFSALRNWASDVIANDGQNVVGAIRFEDLRNNRKGLGFKIWPKEVVNSTDRVAGDTDALKSVYSALKDDIQYGAGRVSPEALEAVQTHDNFVSQMRDPQGQLDAQGNPAPLPTMPLHDIGELVKDNPASLLNHVFSGNIPNSNKLQQVAASLSQTPEGKTAWQNFGAYVYRNLWGAGAAAKGPAADANFSFAKGLTNWKNMPEGLKTALWPNMDKTLRGAMDDLATMAGAAGNAEGYNFTQSGNVVNKFATLSNLVRGLAGTGGLLVHSGVSPATGATMLGAAVAPESVYRMAQHPMLMRWLASTAKATMNNPSALGNWLGRLGAMKFDSSTQPAVDAFLQQQGARQPPNTMPGQGQ